MRPVVRTFAVTCGVTALAVLLGLGALSGIGPLVTVVGPAPIGPATFGELAVEPTIAPPVASEPAEALPFALQLPPWLRDLFFMGVLAVALLVVLRFVTLVATRVEQRRNLVAVDPEPAQAVEPELEVEQVQESFAEALQVLRTGVDAHGAIIECWRRLARLASESGVPRRASQTAEEYTVAILGSLPVDRADLATLVTRYEAAMFSGVEPSDADRHTAIAALERMSGALGAAAPGATP